jgi:Tfp pilus assembly protein PilN
VRDFLSDWRDYMREQKFWQLPLVLVVLLLFSTLALLIGG